MTLDEAIKHFGSKVSLAEAVGLSRSRITQWGDEIPHNYQCVIQVKTNGALKADPMPETKAA